MTQQIASSGIVIFGSEYIKCRPGCSRCNPQKPDICIECLPRYFLISNDYSTGCKFCSEGCTNCSNYHNCTNCLSNYILVNGNCFKCEDNCQTCSTNSLLECLSCKRGFILAANGSCLVTCGKGCLECFEFTKECFACAQGYALEGSRNLCIKCLSSCSGTCDPRNITICTDCV
jgi:hypothetical protein